ncbi:MAG: hypothetical protein WDM91_10955 [Rhizomicrobium sp.]
MTRPDPADIADYARLVFGCVGIGLIGYGAWLVYRPAAFIITGALLLGIAVLGSIRAAR